MNQLIDLRPRIGVWHRRGRTIILDDPFAADPQQTETPPLRRPRSGQPPAGGGDYVGNLPVGPRTTVPGVLSITARRPSPGEQASAEWLRDQGFTLELRDPGGSRGGLGTSDIVVSGQIWDIYVPESGTPLHRILDATAAKVEQVGSRGGVLVNLRNSSITVEAVRRVLANALRQGRKSPLRSLRNYVFFRR